MTRGILVVVLVLAAARFACGEIPGLGLIKCVGCERDEDGKIKRSRAVVNTFRKSTPPPPRCRKGYRNEVGNVATKAPACIVDHIVPLACALTPADQKRLDQPVNMQWQTKAEAVEKDRWERQLCGLTAIEKQRLANSHGYSIPREMLK